LISVYGLAALSFVASPARTPPWLPPQAGNATYGKRTQPQLFNACLARPACLLGPLQIQESLHTDGPLQIQGSPHKTQMDLASPPPAPKRVAGPARTPPGLTQNSGITIYSLHLLAPSFEGIQESLSLPSEPSTNILFFFRCLALKHTGIAECALRAKHQNMIHLSAPCTEGIQESLSVPSELSIKTLFIFGASL